MVLKASKAKRASVVFRGQQELMGKLVPEAHKANSASAVLRGLSVTQAPEAHKAWKALRVLVVYRAR